jgi:hypothetical protein
VSEPAYLRRLLDRLQGVKRTSPAEWFACCPAHNDGSPSLHVTLAPDDKILLWDFGASCVPEAVMRAVNLAMADLYPPNARNGRNPRHPLTLAAFAVAKGLPLEFLREQGVREDGRGLPIEYRLMDGPLAPLARCERRRTALAAGEGSSSWDGRTGGGIVPYGLCAPAVAREKSVMFLEGETDWLSAELHNVRCPALSESAPAHLLAVEHLDLIDTLCVVQEFGASRCQFVAGVAAQGHRGAAPWRVLLDHPHPQARPGPRHRPSTLHTWHARPDVFVIACSPAL